MTDYPDFDAFRAAVGTEIGVSDWLTVEQDRIDTFADATDDHQWIHVDPERAAAGPFGRPIAHGFLTLSLSVPLVNQAVTVGGVKMGINYGLNRVRFITPVPVGGRIRARVTLDAVKDVPGGIESVRTVTIELEGAEKPACVAESIVRLLG
ncbi:MaoC family dehydratase [Nocardia aurantia]|uniref:Putative enoyl-CoA hydratase 1 n=1 Tax=Nocardia aurantia TaxID=2585199 RepID=A0A7K0DIW4_9NOCA|nr:MaoC family dehydratase [Nocardia aurantia]MQY25607.1 putative enoyl-CoA hydratase 1 [Nocardia aurantia]